MWKDGNVEVLVRGWHVPCHPCSKSFTIVVDGSSLNLKQKLDFVDGMKLKGHNSTPPNQP
jgi:hypothetical protein